MDKRILKERMRAKRRQMMIRRAMKLGTMAVGAILVVILIFKGIIFPIVHKIGGGSEPKNTVEAQAETNEANEEGSSEELQEESGGEVQTTEAATVAAVRMPIRGSGDAAKVSTKTVGWQEDSVGKWYQNADGSYYANGLMELDGKTYYFDANGYLTNGWVTLDGVDKWFNDDGSLDATKTRPMVALTFDDGPGERTGELLDCLEQYGAHATFFMQGVNLENYASRNYPKRMLEIGCELGNHSYSHPDMRTISYDEITNQFGKVDELVAASAGQETTVLRFPFGSYDQDIQNLVNKPSFMWDIDTLDWSTHNAENTINVVMNNVSDGDIVLLHDIHTETIDAALQLIPKLIDEGYKLVTVSEMAKAKGITLKGTEAYTDFLPATVENIKANQGDTGNEEGEYIDDYGDNGDFDSEDDGDFEEE